MTAEILGILTSPNAYGYVLNRPTYLIDPRGLSTELPRPGTRPAAGSATQPPHPPTDPRPKPDENDVAVYDPNDRIAPHFAETADEYDAAYSVDSPSEAAEKIAEHVEKHGPIDRLGVVEHGNRGGQYFGEPSVRLPVDWFRKLAEEGVFADDAVIVLYGCRVGSNSQYCQAIADATGCEVIASCGLVYHGPPTPKDNGSVHGRPEPGAGWHVYRPGHPPSPGHSDHTKPPKKGDNKKTR